MYDLVYLIGLTAITGYFTYELVLLIESIRGRVVPPPHSLTYRIRHIAAPLGTASARLQSGGSRHTSAVSHRAA